MSQKNFSNLGDEIKDIVQNAVNTMDFHQINRDIEHTVRSALNEIRGSLGNNHRGPEWKEPQDRQNQWNGQGSSYNQTNRQQNPGNWNQSYTARGDFRQRARDQRTVVGRNAMENRSGAVVPKQRNEVIPYVEVGRVSGILLTVFGSIGVGLFGIGSLVLVLLGYILNQFSFFGTIAAGLIPLLMISFFLMAGGGKNRKRVKRFRRYRKTIGGRSYCSLEELSQSTGWSRKFVLKDIRRMISLGMFLEGRIDEQETCVILNRESYHQYLETMKSAKLREIEQQKQAMGEGAGRAGSAGSQEAVRNSAADLSPEKEELRKALESGRACIQQMKEANEEIPGEEISRKLYRMEVVTGRIFDYVELHPAQLPEIQKFMEYYLPTTLKLINAYREFDRQPVQGENITTAKKEIESTLDTINHAFETLLDSLYEDAAMDVSTDISVLETMLAQEGLTPGELKANNDKH